MPLVGMFLEKIFSALFFLQDMITCSPQIRFFGFLLITVIFSGRSMSEGNIRYAGDTTDVSNIFRLNLFLKTHRTVISLKNSEKQVMKWIPHTGYSLGMSIYYKGMSLNGSVSLPLTRQTETKGNTKTNGIRLDFIDSDFWLSAKYLIYRGFYTTYPGHVISSVQKYTHIYLLSSGIILSMNPEFDLKKLIEPHLFPERKSKSFLWGFHSQLLSMGAQNLLLPEELTANFEILSNTVRITSIQSGMKAGFGSYFVKGSTYFGCLALLYPSFLLGIEKLNSGRRKFHSGLTLPVEVSIYSGLKFYNFYLQASAGLSSFSLITGKSYPKGVSSFIRLQLGFYPE